MADLRGGAVVSIAQRLIMGYNASGGGGATDPNFSDVKLLCHFDGSNGAASSSDSSSVANTLTFYGNAQLNTTNKVFGSASLALDGAGDYVVAGDTSSFAFMHQPSAIWTFETRAKFNSFSGTQCLFSTATGPSTDTGVIIYLSGRSVYLDIYRGVNSTWAIAGAFSTQVPNDTDWHSILVSWDHTLASDNAELYVDGTLYGRMSKTANAPSSSASSTQAGRLGAYGAGAYLNGYMDEVRITNALRRQTSDYTPDSTAFPDS